MSPKLNKYVKNHDEFHDKDNIIVCNIFISKIMMCLIGKKKFHLSHNMRLI